jgi:hypothetical protein
LTISNEKCLILQCRSFLPIPGSYPGDFSTITPSVPIPGNAATAGLVMINTREEAQTRPDLIPDLHT